MVTRYVFLIFCLYCFNMVERCCKIGILLIAGAVEINFVLYDANMLRKDVSRKPRLCAPFYRACPDRPRTHIS